MRSGSPNDFQTPPAALVPLLRYVPASWTVWECACGKGNLVGALKEAGYPVVASDLYVGETRADFLIDGPPNFDCVVTNPPFSLKDEFLARCYLLGKPFALLLPITALGGVRRQTMYRKHGLQVLMLGRRVHFETPSGNGTGAWQEHAWFTSGLNLPSDLVFGELP
jgi:hypothetical protein